ncbi:MAG: MBL fold metallo-hydrolase [Flavobacteriales bacterium]
MEITFLGTGTSQGVPLIACHCVVCQSSDPKDKRLRSSILVCYDDKNYVIDSGPDFRQQMLREQVQDLEALMYTHEHKDHIAGMDDVRAFNYINKKAMEIYCSGRVEENLMREFPYVFADEKYPGVPDVNLNRISKSTPFQLGSKTWIPVEVMHYKLPVLSFRIDDFAYITDANFISEEELEKLKGVKVLIINALRKEKHSSHFTLDEALELIARLKVKRAYLSHISHQLGNHQDVERELPSHVRLAYDGLKINI